MNKPIRDLWNQGLHDEIEFWEQYLITQGLQWKGEYKMRLDSKSPLLENLIIDRLNEIPYDTISILDIGAGPMTVIGKILPGKTLNITATDPLADEFNRILQNLNIIPPVRTIRCQGEELLEKFNAQSFDFAFARNSIDHSCDPLLIIKNMFTIVKKKCWVLLRHKINEAKKSGYQGLHQWNFDIENNDFIIWNNEFKYNISKIFGNNAQVDCYYEDEWVICALKKLSEYSPPGEPLNYLGKNDISSTSYGNFDTLRKRNEDKIPNHSLKLIHKIFSKNTEQSELLKKERLFCTKPFKWFEIFSWAEIGAVHLCCAGWLDMSIGNLQYQSVEEIWNSKNAQKIRRSILDGSFKYCNRVLCPYLKTVSGPVIRIENVKDEELLEVIQKEQTILSYGPRAINCSYDRSCNLYCPSCRNNIIIETSKNIQILNIQHKIQNEALKEAHLLYITGTGDPFGSPYYRKWLQTMKNDDMPNLKEIFLHTNAQLWTKNMWHTIPKDIQKLVKTTEISIDATSPETYAINRRGGNFEKLLENLEFISELRKHGPIETMKISMVVQENNFLEMPEFVRLGKHLNVDTVFFSQLVNWGTYSDEEFAGRAIHFPEHHRHSEFADILKNPIFKEPIVHLGNLAGIS